jgi:hypothetical protein
MIRVSDSGYSPTGTALANIVAANPGALWLVGNEPDCIYQDNTLPQNYAQIYHDAYYFIKGLDPTARVAAGGIVQPTPLRIQYLEIVLDTYMSLYSETLPTDAWHIHTFILREVSCAVFPDSCWGCEIPPGITADHGMLYTLGDTDRLDIFQERIVQFRQWMRDRGYQKTPLIITEYGSLLPYYDPESLYYDLNGNPFDEARAKDFLYGTFDFMLTADDLGTGHPADENRLVQRWLWYSLDDTSSYGGALFEPVTLQPLQLGNDFEAYAGAVSPTADLFAVEIEQVGPIPFSPTDTVTITLRAQVSNVGNIAITHPITIRLEDSARVPIASDRAITGGLTGCAATGEVTVTWPNLPPGAHTVYAVVDPEGTVSESNEDNNEVEGTILVAAARIFLPLTLRAVGN